MDNPVAKVIIMADTKKDFLKKKDREKQEITGKK